MARSTIDSQAPGPSRGVGCEVDHHEAHSAGAPVPALPTRRGDARAPRAGGDHDGHGPRRELRGVRTAGSEPRGRLYSGSTRAPRLAPRIQAVLRHPPSRPHLPIQAPHYDLKGGVAFGHASRQSRVIARVPTAGSSSPSSTSPRSYWSEDYSPLTRKRFFPSDVDHNRWLYSTEIRFTRAWADDSMMEAEPTLDPEVEATPSTPPPPITLEKCLADIAVGAMPDERCGEDLLPTYCAEHPDFVWCPRSAARLTRGRGRSAPGRARAPGPASSRPRGRCGSSGPGASRARAGPRPCRRSAP